MSGALYFKKPVLIGLVLAGLGIILLVGLLSGLVARPNNCIEKSKTDTTTNPGGKILFIYNIISLIYFYLEYTIFIKAPELYLL